MRLNDNRKIIIAAIALAIAWILLIISFYITGAQGIENTAEAQEVCETETQSTDYETETWYVNCSALNCRTAPDINSQIITTLPRDTELRIIGADGAWWQVYDGDSLTGWCYGSYLRNTKEPPAQTQLNSGLGNYLGNFRISYYTCDPSENGGSNLTATGQRVNDVVGTCIAADPKVIPYFTNVYIDGVGYRTVMDCGGAIKGNKIDVLVRNKSDIPSCGVYYSNVYLV